MVQNNHLCKKKCSIIKIISCKNIKIEEQTTKERPTTKIVQSNTGSISIIKSAISLLLHPCLSKSDNSVTIIFEWISCDITVSIEPNSRDIDKENVIS